MVAGEDADEDEDKTVVDDNTACNVEVGEAFADDRVVDVAIEKTTKLAKDVADVSIVEEAIDSTAEIAEKVIEESGVELATDCTVEVVDGVTGNEEVARTVESATIDDDTLVDDDVGTALNEVATPDDVATPDEVTRTVETVAVVEDDVGSALVETATPRDVARTVEKTVDVEDDVGTALEERLSALIMSAAFARVLGSDKMKVETGFHTFSATPYTTACKCAAGITGKIPASTTLRFCIPRQITVGMTSSRQEMELRRLRATKRAFYSRYIFFNHILHHQGRGYCETYPKPVGASPQHRPAQVGALLMCRWGGTPYVFRC